MLINKLRSELDYVNRQLVRSYTGTMLKKFLNIEKEIQVQTMYLKMENKNE
jgi:hypothetical protein